MSTLMTVQEIADYLRVNTKTVYRLLEKGKIPATRVGHLWRFDKSSIDAWLRTYSNSSVTADILVIDDDDAVCALFKETLDDAAYKVSIAQDALTGLEMVRGHDYDMVFLDLKLPGMDGAELFKQIRVIKPELPVTIITGYPDSEIMMNALASGPFGVMKKPFSTTDILTAVNNYVRFAMQSK